jgi:hypothetical protein
MAEVSFATNLRMQSEAVTGNKTLDEGDNGVVQVVTADATITLPSTVDGYSYTIMNGGSGSTDGSIAINVSPAALDKIMGNGFTSADNKDAINTNGNYGDYIKLVGEGTNGWVVAEVVGTWTREA